MFLVACAEIYVAYFFGPLRLVSVAQLGVNKCVAAVAGTVVVVVTLALAMASV